MSWGQREIWNAMVNLHSSIPLGGTKPLPPGTTVEDVARELAYLMGRFPSMRTRLRFDGEGGRPRQELFGSGETELRIYEAGQDDPGDAAFALESLWRGIDFDYAGAWPVRMGVVLKHGEVAYMVVLMCHLVTDAGGAQVMLREVEARETAAPNCLQPVQQALWQRSPTGVRHNAMALRYWEKCLRSLPPRPPAVSADPREPRYWGGQFHSRALRLAVDAIAGRTGTDTSPILLALFAIAVGRVRGTSPLAVRSVVNNRFRPGLAEVVAQVAQSGVCVLDVAEVTVDEAVERARRGSISAYKYAYFDPDQMQDLIKQLALERGHELDIARFFNDNRVEGREKPATPRPPVTPGQLSEARDESSFVWIDRQDSRFERMFIHVFDDPAGIMLYLTADTHYNSPADLEAVAWTMEAVAVEAAVDPDMPTGVVRAGE
jgi:hypothetical protein